MGSEEDAVTEQAWANATEQRPFRDSAFRGYLDALPALLKAGHADKWFVCDSFGSQWAVGDTCEEAEQNFALKHNSRPVLEVRISPIDIVTYSKYFCSGARLRSQMDFEL